MIKQYNSMILVFLFILLYTASAFAATSIPFTINLSKAVNVTGSPRITVDVGGVTRYATYSSGSGTSALIFTYSMTAGDFDLDGVTISSPIDLNGGTIKDLAGNDLSPLTFTAPNTTNVKVNYPSLGMDFVADADGRYTLNGTVYNDLTTFLSAAGGSFTRASVGTYFDSSGVLQTAASGVPRFDYDPVTHAAKGILLEINRTNSIRNSTMAGAAVGTYANNAGPGGTGGSRPTNWVNQSSLASGLTAYIAAIGTENGMNYIDVRLTGTASAAGNFGLYFEGTTSVPAASGQTWTASAYFKLISASGAYTQTNFNIIGRDSGGAGSGDGANINISPTSTLTRYSVTGTFSSATTAYAHPAFQIQHNAGAIDVTVRVYAPQFEQAAFASSFIPTTTAAVTRTTDSLTIPTGSWYDTSKGTLFSEFNTNDTLAANNPTSASFNSDNNNRIQLRRNNTTNAGNMIYLENTTNTSLNFVSSSWATGSSYQKMGVAYDGTSKSSKMSGQSLISNTHAAIPSVTALYIGNPINSGGNILNGYVKTVKYWPAKISNTQLQLLIP